MKRILASAIMIVVGSMMILASIATQGLLKDQCVLTEQEVDQLAETGTQLHHMVHVRMHAADDAQLQHAETIAQEAQQRRNALHEELDRRQHRRAWIVGSLRWSGTALLLLGALVYYVTVSDAS